MRVRRPTTDRWPKWVGWTIALIVSLALWLFAGALGAIVIQALLEKAREAFR
jgi:hypothetical protein